MATTIDLLKNSSFESKLDSLIAAVGNSSAGSVFTVSLSADGWSSNEQSCSDSRFKVNGYTYAISPNDNYIGDWSKALIYAKSISEDGVITFVCNTEPSSDIVVNILMIEV